MADNSTDGSKSGKNNSQKIHERPLDPTRDAEDFLGDPTGRAGVTTGDARQISAEPDEVLKDDSILGGGTIQDPTRINPGGFTNDQLSDAEYDKQILQGISATRADADEDLASEDEIASGSASVSASSSTQDDLDDPMGTNTSDDDDAIPVAESGEETVSGTAPDVESDDDVGQMMKAYTGKDPDPNMDNPQELGIGEVIDEAEEDIRTS